MEAVKERGENRKKNGFFCCRAESEGRHAGERIKTSQDSNDEIKGNIMPPKADL